MMNKVFIIILIVVGLFSYDNSIAQETWTLQKCIEYAKVNNITIKRQHLYTEIQKNNSNQSKLDLIPSLNARSNYNVGFGRYFDETENAYVDNTTQGVSGGISSSTTLFQGFAKQQNIKQQKYNLLAAIELTNETENTISLYVASYYLQILFDKELLEVAKEQHEVTRLQVVRTQKLVDAGTSAMGTLLEMKSQLAKESLNVTTQENSLNISILNLMQILDIEPSDSFDIVIPNLPDVSLLKTDKSSSYYNEALKIMPEIKRSEYELKASDHSYKKAKGYLYPSISANAGWNTQASKYEFTNWDFKNSLKANKYSYFGFSLSIPIFNGYSTQTAVKNAKIGILDSEYQLQSEKLALRKEVEQAYADAIASQKKYYSSNEAVTSYKESFEYSQKRFDVGLINSVEYNTAKNEYAKAQSQFLQAKYEYILRNKILDFYKGIPLTL